MPMKCLKCGKESKREFCRDCKKVKHNASAILSQNKKKLENLLKWDWLTVDWFSKFILYTENIRKYGKIYMEYKEVKEYKVFRAICGTVNVISGLLAIYGWITLLIIKL